jgi:hypothetical protein
LHEFRVEFLCDHALVPDEFRFLVFALLCALGQLGDHGHDSAHDFRRSSQLVGSAGIVSGFGSPDLYANVFIIVVHFFALRHGFFVHICNMDYFVQRDEVHRCIVTYLSKQNHISCYGKSSFLPCPAHHKVATVICKTITQDFNPLPVQKNLNVEISFQLFFLGNFIDNKAHFFAQGILQISPPTRSRADRGNC